MNPGAARPQPRRLAGGDGPAAHHQAGAAVEHEVHGVLGAVDGHLQGATLIGVDSFLGVPAAVTRGLL